ncbi:hypothetical protein E2C01_047290 [Portunus trituberculatus]|uniref:Uncharacterized protein n=1 Tax=Portunus trituberculatus TaxID=210409 RepID=A0A5B7G0Q9_PORTR|nr:hypothetical protein [Portunus trituberculatus]
MKYPNNKDILRIFVDEGIGQENRILFCKGSFFNLFVLVTAWTHFTVFPPIVPEASRLTPLSSPRHRAAPPINHVHGSATISHPPCSLEAVGRRLKLWPRSVTTFHSTSNCQCYGCL